MKSRLATGLTLGCRILAAALVLAAMCSHGEAAEGRPVRILFLGHESSHHDSDRYYPILAQALGREAIYFDYETDVARALDPAYLNLFDGLLLYANHETITEAQLDTLLRYVEAGHGFIPVHSASACFGEHRDFVDLVGGRFQRHGAGVFTARIVRPDHAAMAGVDPFESWDETYVHADHNERGRTVLMKRGEEPWTWARLQGKGRVFYTASGHDERTWSKPEFHQLLKSGILWAVGEAARAEHTRFIATRAPLQYEPRDDIPNYERRPEPLPYQFPLTPEESMNYTQVPVEFRLELFAAEPDVVNPICMAWDERGRLWVAESVDYPNEVREEGGNDSIKILEDTDGDGRCDKVTVFADRLNIPTSLVFSDGGIIVAHAPEFLFLKDTDGDDRADVRRVLFTGWGKGDTHAGPSSLRYGIDNWIYGTVGYSRFRGNLGGRSLDFGMGVFRLRPDATEMEFLHQFNNNTWGVGFNEAGDVFGSTANNNPTFFGGIPANLYPENDQGVSARMIADSPDFHPITPNIRQVDAFGAYTAGAGHAFATSDAFPPAYRNRIAFINGPTGNLTGRYRMLPDGAGWRAENAFAFLASADEWFSPVMAEVGPDGALWVADWYNFIIQHNPTPSPRRGGYAARTGRGNAHINPNRDRMHGRIYRVVWNHASAPRITSLHEASTTQLVEALGDANQFWRLTAQRLLVQEGRSEAVPALKEKLLGGGPAAWHALWCLHGLDVLNPELHQRALLSRDPVLRRNAIRALGTDAGALQLFFDSAVVTDRDPQVRLVAFNHLSRLETSETVQRAVRQLLADPENAKDFWLKASLDMAAKVHDAVVKMDFELGRNLLPNPSFEVVEDGRPARWRPRTYAGRAEHSVDDSVARSGDHSLRISSQRGADSSYFTSVAVEPNTDYRLSGWVKTENLRGAQGGMMNVHGRSRRAGGTTAVRGTDDWREVYLVFNSEADARLDINLLFGGWGRATGTAWWDDVALNELQYKAVEVEQVQPGDPLRGEKIYSEHPIASCIRCHKIGGNEGGDVGPPLDGIASRKSPEYIRQSVVDPNAAMAEGFEVEVSPMPPVGVLLKPQELEDLIAYLLTLEE